MHSDAKLPIDASEPLYVVELGAGSGKFTFFILSVRSFRYLLLPIVWRTGNEGTRWNT